MSFIGDTFHSANAIKYTQYCGRGALQEFTQAFELAAVGPVAEAIAECQHWILFKVPANTGEKELTMLQELQ